MTLASSPDIVVGKIDRTEGLKKMKETVDRYWENASHIDELSEQDLKTMFVVPMLQALNWDFYNAKARAQTRLDPESSSHDS
jgi:hypothetical protein